MESQFQKWVNLSYFAVAFLLGYVIFSLSTHVIGAYDLEAKFHNVELVMRIVSVVAGAILFAVLYRHDEANQFMNEVMVELSRVTWPTQKETSSGTVVVIVMVIISGFLLGFFDYFWTTLLKWVL
jgi:preprotein translocase SecE subunit